MARIRKLRDMNSTKAASAEGLAEARAVLRYIRKRRIDAGGKQPSQRLKLGPATQRFIRKGSAVISGKQALQLVRAKRILGL